MWDLFLFSVVCVCIPFVCSRSGFLLGPGRWLVHNVCTCENSEQYELEIDIRSKKINRTHNCFDMDFDFKREFNITYAVEIELYQKVDGGFKYHQTMKYDSLCAVFMGAAKKNVQRCLTMAKVNPPDCPIPPGRKSLRNFVMDYSELPKIGVYGTFEARVYVIYDKKRVGCVSTILNFEIRDDDEVVEEIVRGVLPKVKTSKF